MRMPAPSPITKPSRSRSNGRLARSGVVVAGREGPHGAEAADGERRDRGLGAAGDHDVRVAVLDGPHGLADGVSARRAGRHRGPVRPLGAEEDADLARGHVDDHLRHEERADAAHALLRRRRALVSSKTADAADAGADDDPDPLGVLRSSISRPELLERHLGGGDRVLGEEVHAAGLLLVHPVLGVEVLDLAGELGGVLLASKCVMGPMPDRPLTRPCQVFSVPIPRGVMSPMPVTTTLRRSIAAPPAAAALARNAARAGLLLVGVHVVDGIRRRS